MTPTVQAILVALVVAGAASYAAAKLMPAAWRRRFAASVAGLVARTGARDEVVRRVEAKLSSGGACGSCESCRACAAPATDASPSPPMANGRSPALRAIPIRRVG